MKILALEFSSDRRGVAILDDQQPGRMVAVGAQGPEGGRRTDAFALVDRALNESGTEREAIDRLAVGLGPGSYSGIRAAIAVALGWRLARSTALVGVPTMETLAAQWHESGRPSPFVVAIDAQRQEFYVAAYDTVGGLLREVEPIHLVSRAEVGDRVARGATVAGPGLTQLIAGTKDVYPDPGVLARLAARREPGANPDQLEPIYLRETQFVKAAQR